jgi:hypothetical protein
VFGLVLITLAVVGLIGALTPLGGPGSMGGLGGILVFLAVGGAAGGVPAAHQGAAGPPVRGGAFSSE